MIDPVRIGDAWLDRAAIVGVLRNDGKLIVFLRGSKPVTMRDEFSTKEIEALTRGPEKLA